MKSMKFFPIVSLTENPVMAVHAGLRKVPYAPSRSARKTTSRRLLTTLRYWRSLVASSPPFSCGSDFRCGLRYIDRGGCCGRETARNRRVHPVLLALFVLLQISPCQTRPAAIVLHITAKNSIG